MVGIYFTHCPVTKISKYYTGKFEGPNSSTNRTSKCPHFHSSATHPFIISMYVDCLLHWPMYYALVDALLSLLAPMCYSDTERIWIWISLITTVLVALYSLFTVRKTSLPSDSQCMLGFSLHRMNGLPNAILPIQLSLPDFSCAAV